MKRTIVEAGGVLTRRKTVATVHSDASTVQDALNRIRTLPSHAEQVVQYFEELADRLRAAGARVSPNYGLKLPPGFDQTFLGRSMSEEFGELREALYEIVAGPDGDAVRRLAPAAQIAAVARAFFAGRLAQERHLSQYEVNAERGIRDGLQRGDARVKATDAKGAKAAIWEHKALELARGTVIPTRKLNRTGFPGGHFV